MKILVIGGTQFVGRHTVEALVARGDDVTLFHRGTTNPGLFPELEHRQGDRNSDLSALRSGQWDATIDPSAYFPRQVRELASTLGPRGGRYVHVSSISAYASVSGPGSNEDTALATMDDPTLEIVTNETYGPLKALCELATLDSFGPGGAGFAGELPSIVRPTYVAGPFDHTGRFTYWVERIARGGRVIAPGPASNPFQVVDARDLGTFMAALAHGEAQGTFHTVSPPPPFSFGDFLETVASEVAPAGTELDWVDAEGLIEHGVDPGVLPLWAALEDDRDLSALDPSRSLAAGASYRPLRETVRDVLNHETIEPTPLRTPVGLSAERESELFKLLS